MGTIIKSKSNRVSKVFLLSTLNKELREIRKLRGMFHPYLSHPWKSILISIGHIGY
jgi:hypothetical protein